MRFCLGSPRCSSAVASVSPKNRQRASFTLEGRRLRDAGQSAMLALPGRGQAAGRRPRDDDPVLCWIRGYSDGGAIPIRFFLNSYRVISDSYGVFVYDPEAGYARGFAPSYDFKFAGWRNGVMVMKHKDGTLYSCLTGIAFDGPKKGERLKPVPTLTSRWGFWIKHYPQTVAYHMFDKYQAKELPTVPHVDEQKTRLPPDTRLPGEEIVLGVADGGTVRAYPLAA